MTSMDQEQGRGKGRRARRAYTPEFKAGAVRLVLDEGKTIAQVARDLNLTATALGNWVAQERANQSKGRTGLTSEERAELAQPSVDTQNRPLMDV